MLFFVLYHGFVAAVNARNGRLRPFPSTITGDHFSMDVQHFSRNVEKAYERHGYNCSLNAPIQPENTQNWVFSALDMFPTVLAALGCQIQGDRLGLGVNLFPDLETLPEAYGYTSFCQELRKLHLCYDSFWEE